MANEAVSYEVWYYDRRCAEYDSCCGHRHATKLDAQWCLWANPLPGRDGRVEEVLTWATAAF